MNPIPLPLTDEQILNLAVESGINVSVIDYDYCDAVGIARGTRHICSEAHPEQITQFARALLALAAPAWMPEGVARQNCIEAGPGKGLCDRCAQGHYELCRYVLSITVSNAIDALLDAADLSPAPTDEASSGGGAR